MPARLTLSRDIIDQFCEITEKGCLRQTVLKRMGLRRGTFYHWWQAGRNCLDEIEKNERQGRLNREFSKREILCMELFERGTKSLGIAHEKMEMAIVECDDPKVKLQFMKLTRRDVSGLSYQDDETLEETKIDPLALCVERFNLLADK